MDKLQGHKPLKQSYMNIYILLMRVGDYVFPTKKCIFIKKFVIFNFYTDKKHLFLMFSSRSIDTHIVQYYIQNFNFL